MASGRKNKLVGQAGEFLVCAQLAKRGYLATPFAGNVPTFDVLVADEFCNTLAIQVKASTGSTWPAHAKRWLDLDFDPKTGSQIDKGDALVPIPDLITVCVALDMTGGQDRYFVLTAQELQTVICANYRAWMDKHDWKRPRSKESYDARYGQKQIADYENRWELIEERLASRHVNPVPPGTP